MYIRLIAGTVVESDEVRPGVVFDLDYAGRVLGACRSWGVESENRPQRGQFLPDL